MACGDVYLDARLPLWELSDKPLHQAEFGRRMNVTNLMHIFPEGDI